jgi:hypothetical protein
VQHHTWPNFVILKEFNECKVAFYFPAQWERTLWLMIKLAPDAGWMRRSQFPFPAQAFRGFQSQGNSCLHIRKNFTMKLVPCEEVTSFLAAGSGQAKAGQTSLGSGRDSFTGWQLIRQKDTLLFQQEHLWWEVWYANSIYSKKMTTSTNRPKLCTLLPINTFTGSLLFLSTSAVSLKYAAD